MSAIENLARDLWYRTPGKDRRLSRKISAELYRYKQIEKIAKALVEHKKKNFASEGMSPTTSGLISELNKALKIDVSRLED